MTHHFYLEHGLTIFEAKLQSPRQADPAGPGSEIRPFITISRETGAGATTLGLLLLPLLNERLGEEGRRWVFLDKNLLPHALATHHLPARLAEFLPEDRISEIKGVIGELVGLHPPLWQLEEQVTETIRHLAGIGRVIFVGRAAHLVTQSLPGGFHVRLVASRRSRIERMMALLNCDPPAAEAHILKNDLARRRFVKTYFDQDIDDAHLYDLVINTDRIAPASAAHLAVQALCDKLACLAARPAPTTTYGSKYSVEG